MESNWDTVGAGFPHITFRKSKSTFGNRIQSTNGLAEYDGLRQNPIAQRKMVFADYKDSAEFHR